MIPAPLRSDLETSDTSDVADGGCVLKDPRTGTSYRFPSTALRLLQGADGKRGVAEILEFTSLADDLDDAQIGQVQALFEKAASTGLLEGSESSQPVPTPHEGGSKNPLLWRLLELPLERYSRVASLVASVLSGQGRLLALALGVAALSGLIDRWGDFLGMKQVFWHYAFWPETAVGILVTVAWHECGHFAAAKRYGSRKASLGIGLFLLLPVAYVRIGDFRQIRSRKSRVTVALAGTYFDTFSVSITLLTWVFTDNFTKANQIALVLSYFLLTRMALDSIPFLRLDGYMALSELLGRPFLREDACAAFMRRLPVVRRFWEERPHAAGESPRWLPFYGMISTVVMLSATVAVALFWTRMVDLVFPNAPLFVRVLLGVGIGANLLLVVVRDIVRSRSVGART